MLIIVAPGQGAQTPGFLTPWLEDPAFASRMEWMSTVAGIDLVHYGTEADAETIRDTAIAQPLLVATGGVAALALFPHPVDAFGRIGAVAGHSVGEITAAVGARAITGEQGMVLVRERGKAMAAASAVTPTGMTAVLGGDREQVLARLAGLGLTAANENGPGQIVEPALSTSWRSWPRIPRRRPASRRCRSPARSTPSTWPRPRGACRSIARRAGGPARWPGPLRAPARARPRAWTSLGRSSGATK